MSPPKQLTGRRGAQADHAPRQSGARVAVGERVFLASEAEVVLTRLDHDGATDHGGGSCGGAGGG